MKLEDLLERLSSSATNSTQKGSAFERLMASYLRTAPEFADRFEEVYLWQEWPGRAGLHDHGIDIVARDITTGGWSMLERLIAVEALEAEAPTWPGTPPGPAKLRPVT